MASRSARVWSIRPSSRRIWAAIERVPRARGINLHQKRLQRMIDRRCVPEIPKQAYTSRCFPSSFARETVACLITCASVQKVSVQRCSYQSAGFYAETQVPASCHSIGIPVVWQALMGPVYQEASVLQRCPMPGRRPHSPSHEVHCGRWGREVGPCAAAASRSVRSGAGEPQPRWGRGNRRPPTVRGDRNRSWDRGYAINFVTLLAVRILTSSEKTRAAAAQKASG